MNLDEKIKWDGKSEGESSGYSIFVFTIKHLGLRAAYILLFFVPIYFVPFNPRATRAIWFYYRHAFKKSFFSSIYYLFRHYYVFTQKIVDKIAIIELGSDKFTYEFENYDNFIANLKSDEPLIIIGTHIGCWELGFKFFDKYDKFFNIAMLDDEYQRSKDIIARNIRHNNKVLLLGENSLENLLNLRTALERKEYVCFQGDRYINNKVLETEFMGLPALFPSSPFLLASRLRGKVIFYYVIRGRNYKYKLYFAEADISKIDDIMADRNSIELPEIELLSQYIKSLESITEEYPSQWFNFHKFWK